MFHPGGRGNGSGGGPKDSKSQSDAQDAQGDSRLCQPSPSRGGQQASHAWATAATARATPGQRAVSAHRGPGVCAPNAAPGPPSGTSHDFLSPGLERVLQDFKAAGRYNIPAGPGASRRPVTSGPGRRAFSDTTHADAGVPAGESPDQDELSKLREIIEEAVEQQVAAALAPLRVVVNELNKAIQSAGQEHLDLREQNDTLSRQIDLHYRDIREHSEMASTHIRALTNLVSAHTQTNQAANENLVATCTLVGHLSQVIANLPQSLSQVVENVVSQAVQSALGQVADAEKEAMDSIRAFLSSQSINLESPRQQRQQGAAARSPRGNQEVQHDNGGSPRGFGKIRALLSKKQKPGP